jgi:hypothetical protein
VAQGADLRRVLPIARSWPLALAASMLVCVGTMPALAQDATTNLDGGAPYDLDWSVGLRGAYTSDSSVGGSAEAVVAPKVTFTRRGESIESSATADGEFSLDTAGAVRIDTLHAGGAVTLDLDSLTTLTGSTDITLNQLAPDDSSLPTNTLIGPTEITGTAEGSATRKLGLVDIAGRLRGERFIEGATTLDDLSVVDNSDQGYWLGEAGLRVGFELSPLLSVFIDGAESLQKFDAPDPTLLVPFDNRTTTLRAGFSYTQDSTLSAEASAGRAWLDYADPSLTDAPAWVVDASLIFSPDETLSFEGGVETTIGPSSNVLGDTDVDYTLTGSASYEVNPWLKLRGTGSFEYTKTLGSGDTDTTWSAGAGLDFASSRHLVWSADYLYSHDEPSTGTPTDKHIVTVGVTLKR